MSAPKLLNKREAGAALIEAMRHGICAALHRVGECGNRRHGDCLRCRAATTGAQLSIDEFAERNVVEVRT